jgi:hypothetical protein
VKVHLNLQRDSEKVRKPTHAIQIMALRGGDGQESTEIPQIDIILSQVECKLFLVQASIAYSPDEGMIEIGFPDGTCLLAQGIRKSHSEIPLREDHD